MEFGAEDWARAELFQLKRLRNYNGLDTLQVTSAYRTVSELDN